MPARIASQEKNVSSLEEQVAGLLDTLGIAYIRQYTVGNCLVDFYIPEKNLLLEINGCWWHCCEQCGHADIDDKRQKDIKRQYFLRSQGYNVYSLWEHDLKITGIETVFA